MKPAAKKTARRKAYHHGDLADQLVAAAEAIILERGVDGFTLREAARRAGVSPAAPAHHFKDARGLLSEVALRGYRDFGDALEAADRRGGRDPQQRLTEQGLAYVQFALKNPARFQLMFLHGRCDMGYKDLATVSHRSFLILEGAVRAACKLGAGDALTPEAYGFLMATWSIVHGFAHLALGGELEHAAGAGGGQSAILNTFLPLTLKHLPVPRRER
ncbi:MAG TPA: TetR/AcrR family transcriptional regulator [Rhizomicrobium sp.]|jgi:AcrR family transcriptional regulator|nr:TetR/AcrR family transcriptional regulator [Rhizomicrobium sp.]